jgi:hypothetical protein
MGLVVFAFMALSLAVTATGTARFAVAMGYSPIVGYVVGAIFDIAKEILPLAIRALWKRRAPAIILSIAWIGLVTYSVLATHATITTAISAIERTGKWKMQTRNNVQTELGSVEQQLAALSRPTPPRPLKTVRAALAAERVPPGIWKDSRECAAIQESTYFAKACAQVVQLRTELSAAEDYERLSARVDELRTNLAETPIVAISDPLPEAFSATLGRFLPVGGTKGVALLLTMVVEIISCFGLAALSALYNSDDQTTVAGLGLAFVQMANRAQLQVRERDLAEPHSSAQLGSIDVPSFEPQTSSNSLSPSQQPSFQPKANDPTLAKVGPHDPVKPNVEPSLQPEPKISPPAELDEHSTSVKPGVQPSLQPRQPSSPVDSSLLPIQPAASSGSRSLRPSEKRYSMTMFWPTT